MNFTLTEAMEYAREDRIGEWLQAFLRNEDGPMPNPSFVLADELLDENICIFAPVEMPLDVFKTIRVAKDIEDENDLKWFEHKVKLIEDMLDSWDMPPLISRYDGKEFWLNDGSHRYSALLKMGTKTYYTIVFCDKDKIGDLNVRKKDL